MLFPHPPLAISDIDRDAPTRLQPDLLAAAWREESTRVLCLRGAEVLVRPEAAGLAGPADVAGQAAREAAAAGAPATDNEWRTYPLRGREQQVPYELRMLTVAELAAVALGDEPDPLHPRACGPFFLGRRQGAALFSYNLPAHTEAAAIAEGTEWHSPLAIAAQLPQQELPVIGTANALTRWHENSAFSSRDAAATSADQGGWRRVDESGAEHFPRTDPAVIVLIEHEGRVLLGSNVLWEAGRYSLLAGFVEAGESLEQACIREVREEAGIDIANLRYRGSQPWPFPRSLMLGFYASLAPGQHPTNWNADPEEIAELRWFTPQEILSPPDGITLPGEMSIAHWLLATWATEQLEQEGQ